MVATPNNPAFKVRQVQRGLFMSAKQSRTRRFHALYDRICRSDVLAEEWERVKANKAAAGPDGETVSMIEQEGVEGFLQETQRRLRTGMYRPHPVRRRYNVRIVLSNFKGREYLFRWPSPRAMNRIRIRIRELTDRRRWAGLKDIRQVIDVLNPVLRGWGNYFRTGNASLKFQQVDRYVNGRLVRLLRHVRSWRRRPFSLRERSPARFAAGLGLYRLVGTIRYRGQVNAT